MQIYIHCVGKIRDQVHAPLLDEYKKRLIAWPVTIKEHAEGTDLLAHCPKGAVLIALDERGQSLSSVQFAQILQRYAEQHPPALCFLIGGADGHPQAVKTKAHTLLAMGAMTWPHKLARIMLLEQIYRAQQILAGHPYHREGPAA